MEDCLGQKDLNEGEIPMDKVITPIATFHPNSDLVKIGKVAMEPPNPQNDQEQNLTKESIREMTPKENQSFAMDLGQETLMPNESQVIVHSADRAYLLEKSKWLVLKIATKNVEAEPVESRTQEEAMSAHQGRQKNSTLSDPLQRLDWLKKI
jgi:hypothetical protein